MEMIIGGAYQGKTEYARKQYPQLRWSDGGSVTEEELMNAQGVVFSSISAVNWRMEKMCQILRKKSSVRIRILSLSLRK